MSLSTTSWAVFWAIPLYFPVRYCFPTVVSLELIHAKVSLRYPHTISPVVRSEDFAGHIKHSCLEFNQLRRAIVVRPVILSCWNQSQCTFLNWCKKNLIYRYNRGRARYNRGHSSFYTFEENGSDDIFVLQKMHITLSPIHYGEVFSVIIVDFLPPPLSCEFYLFIKLMRWDLQLPTNSCLILDLQLHYVLWPDCILSVVGYPETEVLATALIYMMHAKI